MTLAVLLGLDRQGAKACDTKLSDTTGKKCPSGVRTSAFGLGACASEAVTGTAKLQTCLDRLVECEVCFALNQTHGLNRDSDDFDDGVVNGSCP